MVFDNGISSASYQGSGANGCGGHREHSAYVEQWGHEKMGERPSLAFGKIEIWSTIGHSSG
jgi:hypothetical protein